MHLHHSFSSMNLIQPCFLLTSFDSFRVALFQLDKQLQKWSMTGLNRVNFRYFHLSQNSAILTTLSLGVFNVEH